LIKLLSNIDINLLLDEYYRLEKDIQWTEYGHKGKQSGLQYSINEDPWTSAVGRSQGHELEYTNLNTFFKDMENIVIYDNETELFEKLNVLSLDNNLIKKISNSGYELVKNNHTYDNRVDVLLKIISDYI
jgi:hypothetical protein